MLGETEGAEGRCFIFLVMTGFKSIFLKEQICEAVAVQSSEITHHLLFKESPVLNLAAVVGYGKIWPYPCNNVLCWGETSKGKDLKVSKCKESIYVLHMDNFNDTTWNYKRNRNRIFCNKLYFYSHSFGTAIRNLFSFPATQYWNTKCN